MLISDCAKKSCLLCSVTQPNTAWTKPNTAWTKSNTAWTSTNTNSKPAPNGSQESPKLMRKASEHDKPQRRANANSITSIEYAAKAPRNESQNDAEVMV